MTHADAEHIIKTLAEINQKLDLILNPPSLSRKLEIKRKAKEDHDGIVEKRGMKKHKAA